MATPRKAAAPTPPAVDEYDFDSWTQEDEDKALIALNDVRYIIVEGDFVGKFADGTIVRIPLSLPMSIIDELQEKFDTPLEQFRHLLRLFAGEEIAASLSDRSMIPVAIMTEKFFRAMARAQELAFPQS